jgi:hypothetical protein
MRLHPAVSAAYTATGAVLLDQRTGRYWQLNPTGADVIRAVATTGGVTGVAGALAAAYDVRTEVVEQDVAALLGFLRTRGLVVDAP